ncbi:MAG: rod shape-determining protein [Deltaproteobacteria bacterium]|nr:rod shape-determining protein [Deltaproteobacteria bacterium]MBW2070740.1 rod shape-determining protein [Deltaproteobacteria bacterium]
MKLVDYLVGLFSKDLAMDLGTANTLIYMKGEGIVLNEPSVVAISRTNGRVIAVGREAKEFLGRTPQKIVAIRPMKDGVIADFEVTSAMIKYFLGKVHKRSRLFRPRLIVAVPTGITQVEKRAVIESAEQAGARQVHLIEEPMAAAIGAGLPISKPVGNMVVDIGGGTTEVAVISLSAIAYAESVRVAGDEANEAISRYVQQHYQIAIGENEAERIKLRIGSATPLPEPMTMEGSGKEILTGLPRSFKITDRQVREALEEPVNVITESVKRAFEKTPPELAADIYGNGVWLAGGGALLRGLDTLLSSMLDLKVYVEKDPLTTVARGAGQVMESLSDYRQVFLN